MREASPPRPRRARPHSARVRPSVERCESRLLLATYTVINTLDAGAGSLRMAIQQANADRTPDRIQFAIGVGTQVIRPATPLPAITNAVEIDGTSQPGYVDKPMIVIDGSGSTRGDGLTILADKTIVKGLAVINFKGSGISIGANNCAILSDFVGVNAPQETPAPNSGDGILLFAFTSGNVIGQPGAGNLIGGNGGNGIELSLRTSANLIQANIIGLSPAQRAGPLGLITPPNLRNGADGILMTASSSNTIGGTAAGAGNLISNNGGNGLNIAGGQANLIQGNTIGTDVDAKQPAPNASNGILVGNASANTIGGTAPGAANVVSGNAGNGITVKQLRGSATGNLIQGNTIGVGLDGLTPLGNSGFGIQLDAAPGNAVVGNLVGSNNSAGISVNQPTASRNSIRGNLIGINAANVRLGNVLDGIVLFEAPDNTIGGTTAADRNVISENGGNGVSLRGPNSTRNLVQGNYIGVEASGGADRVVGNIADGVFIENAPGNTVGGSAAGAGNVISLNRVGVDIVTSGAAQLGPDERDFIGSKSDGNVVQGNKIGTDATGTQPEQNFGSGVLIQCASDTLVGGPLPGQGNLISANLVNGVEIDSIDPTIDPTVRNVVQGNVIGLDITGADAPGNRQAGIALFAAHDTTIGGSTPGAGNIISGNVIGLDIIGGAPGGPMGVPMGVVVQGNIIGLGFDGLRLNGTPGHSNLNNTGDGILLEQGAAGVTIGGTAPGAGNVISGNGASGIRFASGSTANLIQGNRIGVARDGQAPRPNNQSGIFLAEASSSNTIGGDTPGAGNVISGNTTGITLTNAGTSRNLIQGNTIGLAADGNTPIGNTAYGFLLLAGTTDNTIGGTTPGARNVVSANGQGITIDGPGVSRIVIEGNYFGTDATGSLPRGNERAGLALNDTDHNTIGGTAAGAGNVISGNNAVGLILSGARATANFVAGNLVGLDATGTRAFGPSGESLGNAGFGIQVDNAPFNSIGGTSFGARNVVSGNRLAGIAIGGSGSLGAVVQGNIVGLDASGSAVLGNLADGILVDNTPGVVIGGITAPQANIVSGNLGNGIEFSGAGSFFDEALGNLIGTSATGGGALGNGLSGVFVNGAPAVTIGGTNAALRNVISANGQDGVRVAGGGSAGTVVVGNLIGVDASGRGPLGNLNDGVLLDGAALVTVGGTAPGSTNVISANGSSGVEFGGPSTALDGAQGNLIGVDSSGTVALGNAIGVLLNNAPFNLIGGSLPFSGNLISGNAGPGVFGAGVGAHNDAVQGNRIGTNLAGTAALANQAGVFVNGSASNLIGGTAPASGNLISGNTAAGVVIQGTGATADTGATLNVVQGNLIGTDVTGTRAIGAAAGSAPQQSGVLITDAPANVVGGTTPPARNVISGNAVGLVIAGFNSRANLALGNFLGTDAAGAAAVPNGVGAYLNGASANTIGGTAPGSANLISGNATTGVTLLGPQAAANLVAGNRIGTDLAGAAAVPNQEGVYIEGALSNTVGGPTPAAGNTISGNSVAGVYLFSGAASNLIQGNTIGLGSGGGALGNLQYGVLLFNAANNTVDRSAATGNRIANSGIGDFREFTGAAPTSTTTTTTTTRKAPAKVVKKASVPAGPRAHPRP